MILYHNLAEYTEYIAYLFHRNDIEEDHGSIPETLGKREYRTILCLYSAACSIDWHVFAAAKVGIVYLVSLSAITVDSIAARRRYHTGHPTHIVFFHSVCSLGQNSSSIVTPIVDINPQDDIVDKIKDNLGLGSIDDGSFTDKWYFWLIIAIVICAFIVLVYFSLRGFRKYIIYRKKMVRLYHYLSALFF